MFREGDMHTSSLSRASGCDKSDVMCTTEPVTTVSDTEGVELLSCQKSGVKSTDLYGTSKDIISQKLVPVIGKCEMSPTTSIECMCQVFGRPSCDINIDPTVVINKYDITYVVWSV